MGFPKESDYHIMILKLKYSKITSFSLKDVLKAILLKAKTKLLKIP
jgi:hypothetical protein